MLSRDFRDNEANLFVIVSLCFSLVSFVEHLKNIRWNLKKQKLVILGGAFNRSLIYVAAKLMTISLEVVYCFTNETFISDLGDN